MADRKISNAAFITGWILTILPCLLFIGGGAMALIAPSKEMNEGFEKMGWQAHHMRLICALEILCAILYLIPATSVLGAILLTGYLGGAVATHVRVDDHNWFIAILFGIVIWLGLFLRDTRLRDLIPLRT
jgi:hypothetical protein